MPNLTIAGLTSAGELLRRPVGTDRPVPPYDGSIVLAVGPLINPPPADLDVHGQFTIFTCLC